MDFTQKGFPQDLKNHFSNKDILEKLQLSEKIAHFNREKIPERITHAKGVGVYGEFTTEKNLKNYTKAGIFSEVGKKTKVFVRFSNYKGDKGSADTVRDPKGFAVRFYTENGNWDIAGNNIPLFYIRDASKLPDLIHSQKKDPKTNLYSETNLWDFFSFHPESLHAVLMNYSERGIPFSYRTMDGFSCHAFSFINSLNEIVYVKFHFKSLQGIQNLSSEEAEKLCSKNPDHYQEDMNLAIQQKNFPEWELYVQILHPQELAKLNFDPFDVTKVWPHSIAKEERVGKLVLNELPNDNFSEVEQVAFSPSNVIEGIGFSPDPLLRARLFAYPDAQRHRLGVNYHLIGINQSLNKIKNKFRDGIMRVDANGSGEKNFYPNTEEYLSSDNFIDEQINSSYYSRQYPIDDFTQPQNLLKLFTEEQKETLVENLSNSMKNIPNNIKERQICHFYRLDNEFAFLLSENLGIDFLKIKELSKLSFPELIKATSKKDERMGKIS